jgi:thiamine kinase-like enzyme
MEEIIKTNLRKYVQKLYKIDSSEKYIGVTLKNLGGLSNINFVATISNKSTNERICYILYRHFGEISDVVDRDLETMIIDELANKGIGPKIYYADPNNKYRLNEYLENTLPIPKEDEFNPNVIDQIINIIINYSLISNLYKYNITNEVINFSILNDIGNSKTKRINKNQFDACMTDMYIKALKAFETFSEKFTAAVPQEGNEEYYCYLEKFDYYLKNYKKMFLKVFPKEGFLILCHNDVHRLNFIIRQNDNKLFILDHEYACLNLPGNDIANYMNESNFIYEPDYIFTKEKINFDKYYEFYKIYLKAFEENYKILNDSKFGKEFLSLMKTKKYYIQLHQILNLFWLLYSAIYLNFENWNKDHNDFYYLHFIHRIQYIEKGDEALEALK